MTESATRRRQGGIALLVIDRPTVDSLSPAVALPALDPPEADRSCQAPPPKPLAWAGGRLSSWACA